MASLNQAEIIGHLGRDPETRYLPSGDAITNISVATTESWKDKEGVKQEKTEWHRVSFFGKLAEIAGEYLKKGGQVYVRGRLQTRKWQDKDGNDKYTTEIVGDKMLMLGSRPEGGRDRDEEREAEPRRAPAQKPATKPGGGGAGKFDDFDDDIPFLFNVAAVCDNLGVSKAHARARYGKGLQGVWAYKARLGVL